MDSSYKGLLYLLLFHMTLKGLRKKNPNIYRNLFKKKCKYIRKMMLAMINNAGSYCVGFHVKEERMYFMLMKFNILSVVALKNLCIDCRTDKEQPVTSLRAPLRKKPSLVFQPHAEQMLTRSSNTFHCNYSVYTDTVPSPHTGVCCYTSLISN